MKILAFESSCDDSSMALLDKEGGIVLWEKTLNRAKLHAKFGGIVPEIAGRSHLISFDEILGEYLEAAETRIKDIEAIAVTSSPGLIGSLLVGFNYAKTVSWMWGKPLLGIDHIVGHMFSAFIGKPDVKFPFLCAVISGGHTLLLHVTNYGEYELLGRTMDDALGEAFDKSAKILGLSYPGGPHIERLALHHETQPIAFPLPLKGKKTLDFSFSGLKTAVLYTAQDLGLHHPDKPLQLPDELLATASQETVAKIRSVAKGFQNVVGELLNKRLRKAIELTGVNLCTICGGVAANKYIRGLLTGITKDLGTEFVFPEMKYCIDNAAMIAYAAKLEIETNRFSNALNLTSDPASQSLFTKQ